MIQFVCRDLRICTSHKFPDGVEAAALRTTPWHPLLSGFKFTVCGNKLLLSGIGSNVCQFVDPIENDFRTIVRDFKVQVESLEDSISGFSTRALRLRIH